MQSPNDKRQYLALTLLNDLPVLLVHQQDAEKSAAALTVNVGHFDDPAERQGLAHFLEHMLFLGTEKYPDAGEYQHFINHHGGSHNAWTGTEHSSFFFDIDTDYFEQALDRFADMFRAPLFHADYIEKERQAIEAEFSLKLKDDSRRIYQVHKETVNPAHPFAKFSVGNLLTLCDTPEQSLQQAVQQFFDSHYGARRMTLCLVSPLPLQQMEQLVHQYFAALPNHVCAKAPLSEPLYLAEHQALQLDIAPHKFSQRLVASFALPDIQPWYKYKLISFLAHLLGDEGFGSLLAYLKDQGWVNQLSAGGGIDGSNYKDFTLSFELTEQGVFAKDQILEAMFGQLQLLRQSPFPEHLFLERQRLVQWSYLYQEPSTALQGACDLSVNMQHYPVDDYVYGDYRMDLPPEALYRELLERFRPDNMRVMFIAPDIQANREARWYQTPYSVQPLEQSQIEHYLHAKVPPGNHLPQSNPYLVTELKLLSDADHMAKPQLLVQESGFKLWFKADTDFKTPKGHIFVQLNLPNCIGSVSQMACSRLWLELFQDQINESFYAATTAGLTYNLHVQHSGISLHSSGLAGNQIKLVADLLAQMAFCQFDEQRFDEIKRQLIRHWQNHSKNKPVSKLFSQLSSLLQPLNPDIDQLAAALQQQSYSDFIQFHHQLLQQVHLDAFMVGNWHASDATQLSQALKGWLSEQNQGEALPRQRYNTQGIGPVWVKVPVEHSDQALVIYLPSRQKQPVDMALFMLANHLLSPEYFHVLRTEQQLGYLVGTGYVPMNLLPGIAFYIQSPAASCADLYKATLAFYKNFLSELEELDEEEFVQMKQGLATQIKERDSSLGARAKRLWLAIGQGDHQFDLNEQIEIALEQLSLKDFIAFFYQLLAPDYDAIFLATGDKPDHSHLTEQNPFNLLEKLPLLAEWL
ncbi:insulinase family protein [Rheinheimera sp. MM224]|uniref:insulinase family protein n=1 Tax=Rheinheimera sp. MM224 TaxID=3019969 RepID=UPI0021F863B4|nr:insulinase family protein [Rheinheimera sp. MM224]